ncbi:MAG: CIA30 family protein, partial [Planctomycetota bacterium]
MLRKAQQFNRFPLLRLPMRFFLAALALLPLTSRAAPQDLLGTARAAGTFNTLLAALEVAELDRALRPPASFTVFAPTDEAFAALPEGTVEALLEPANREVLIDLLSSHFLPGRLSAADLLQARQVTTSSGREVEIKLNGGSVFIGGARLRDADIQTENGLVHSIDSVILPQVPELNPVEKVAALAIEKGVPLFNAGQPEACAAIYEVAVEAILQLGAEDLPQSVLENARERLEASRHDEDATSRAWTLRPALDAFFTSASGAGDERTLISFDPGEAASKWFTLNDDVMGGISQSQFKVTGDRTGLFTG